MDKKYAIDEKLFPLKTPSDRVGSNGYRKFGKWIPNVVGITGEKCEEYMNTLQILSETPMKSFRIENSEGEGDVNRYWRADKR